MLDMERFLPWPHCFEGRPVWGPGKREVRSRPATGEDMDGTVPLVFVVDDDDDVRSALARLIRALGMQVSTFASARAFLRCPRQDGPACLILDVRLTGEDGLRVQEALWTAAWRPPIIFITGYGTVPQCVRALKGGAIDFLQKPVDEDAL